MLTKEDFKGIGQGSLVQLANNQGKVGGYLLGVSPTHVYLGHQKPVRISERDLRTLEIITATSVWDEGQRTLVIPPPRGYALFSGDRQFKLDDFDKRRVVDGRQEIASKYVPDASEDWLEFTAIQGEFMALKNEQGSVAGFAAGYHDGKIKLTFQDPRLERRHVLAHAQGKVHTSLPRGFKRMFRGDAWYSIRNFEGLSVYGRTAELAETYIE